MPMDYEHISLEDMIKRIDGASQSISLDDSHTLGRLICQAENDGAPPPLDPYSDDYLSNVLKLYAKVSPRGTYEASIDEKASSAKNPNPWTGVTPYSFSSSIFVGDFIEACGAVLKALQMQQGQSVLEYGFGSGQALLFLARMGVEAYGVDIDDGALSICDAQAKAMGLNVQLERNEFGKGFDGKRFDRIFFFEAFHHALKFKDTLVELHDRLNPGGRIVFAGEPIVESDNAIVPYPWGLRLDGFSLFCARKFGWMELGFQSDFFIELLMSTGWRLVKHDHKSFRAVCYSAEPLGMDIEMGGAMELQGGWSSPETNHRWTASPNSSLPLPWLKHNFSTATVTLGNHFHEPKQVTICAGDNAETFDVPPGKIKSFDVKCPVGTRNLTFKSELTSVEGGARQLGIAVKSVKLT